ncbi:MAG: hypothetical protein RMK99_16005 [Anaerolineales bacterium]|nr:hypothetical protein [Anaerolineales bacterium]
MAWRFLLAGPDTYPFVRPVDFNNLEEGQRVEFIIEQTEKGPQAAQEVALSLNGKK